MASEGGKASLELGDDSDINPTEDDISNDIESDGGEKKYNAVPDEEKVPEPAPFDFFRELNIVNKQIVALSGYPSFMLKWFVLQVFMVSGSVSFLVFATVKKSIDFDNLTTDVYIWFIVLGVLQVVSRVSPPLNSLFIDQLKGSLQVQHGTAVIRKLFDMEHDAMISTPTGKFGQLISKIFMNIEKLLPALYGGVLTTIVNLVVGVILLGVLFGPMSLALLGLFLLFTAAAYRSAEQAAVRNKDMMTAMFSEWGKLLSIAQSYERAHFFDRVEFEVENAEQSFENISMKMGAVLRGSHLSSAFLQFTSIGLTTFCVLIIIPLLAKDATSLEIVGLFVYFFTFVGTLEKYAMDITELRSALFEAQALSEFVNARSNVLDVPNAVELPRLPNPEIEFRDVSFSYQDKVILEKVSFKIAGGQTLGLVGASGCGKSTILRLLLRFYRPTTGVILVNNINIETMTGASLRRAFSCVTQTSQLFAASIRDNIEYGKRGSSDKEILAAAKSAELVLDGVDLSLDKDVGEAGAKLSGGQQQRVAIARAMLKNGTIYLLDEPTTGLDGIVAQQLQQTLDALACQATTIMVTHNLEDLRQAHHILYMKDGRVVESGSYQSLCSEGGEFYKQTQARVTAA